MASPCSPRTAPRTVSVTLTCDHGPACSPTLVIAEARNNSRTVPRGSVICFMVSTTRPSMAVRSTANGTICGALTADTLSHQAPAPAVGIADLGSLLRRFWAVDQWRGRLDGRGHRQPIGRGNRVHLDGGSGRAPAGQCQNVPDRPCPAAGGEDGWCR